MVRRRAERDEIETVALEITGIRRPGGVTEAGYQPVTVLTSRGDIAMRHYPAKGADRGIVCVGGVGGDFDTPVRGRLYPDLCRQLSAEGMAGLRVQYRSSTDLLESTLDVLTGVEFLLGEGVGRIGLVGWSFGGAVVVQAGSVNEAVRTVVTISTQSYGIDPAADLGPNCSILLLHGEADSTLPARCSRYGYEVARQPKKLMLHPSANHGLDEWGDEVPTIVADWLRNELSRP